MACSINKLLIISGFLFLFHGMANADTQQAEINLGKKTGEICVIPGKGLCQAKGAKLQFMDSKLTPPRVVFPKSVNSLVANGSQVYARSGNAVYSCSLKLQKAFTFENDYFLMFPTAHKDSLYVVGFSGFTSTIYRCCPKNHTIELVNFIDEDIVYVCDTNEGMMVVTKDNVYIKSGEQWVKLLSFFEQLNSAAYTNKGLILASDNYIVCLVDNNRVAILAETGGKELLSNGDILYVVDLEDNIFRCLLQ